MALLPRLGDTVLYDNGGCDLGVVGKLTSLDPLVAGDQRAFTLKWVAPRIWVIVGPIGPCATGYAWQGRDQLSLREQHTLALLREGRSLTVQALTVALATSHSRADAMLRTLWKRGLLVREGDAQGRYHYRRVDDAA